MGTQTQGGKQIWIADQDQCKGGLLGQVESKKHPYIFPTRSWHSFALRSSSNLIQSCMAYINTLNDSEGPGPAALARTADPRDCASLTR
jgi:hypothetical protein